MAASMLILTAFDLEAAALAKALGLPRHGRRWQAPGIEIHPVALRATNLPAHLGSAGAIVLAGLAGALDPALRVGDVLLDETSHPLPRLPGLQVAKIHTAPRVLTTPQEKAELFAATRAAAVDMENTHVRAEVTRLTTALAGNQPRATPSPFLHLRAISDAAGDPLDPAILNLVDPFGRPRPARLAAGILTRPRIVPKLLRLRRTTTLALGNLGTTLKTILDSGWPT